MSEATARLKPINFLLPIAAIDRRHRRFRRIVNLKAQPGVLPQSDFHRECGVITLLSVSPQPGSQQLHEILETRFKLSTFREGQLEIIQSVIAGRDALAVMPTGGGKSLCYQLPSQAKPGLVIVISPLIALMNDQVKGLLALGIAGGCLHSGQTRDEKVQTFSEIKQHENYILYLSPERVQKEGFATWLRDQKVNVFAIDESHCVSQWGPDFRKDYYKLSLLRQLRPDVPILALTATATPPVLKDITKQLGLINPDKHIHGFYRPNLYFQVESCDDGPTKLEYLHQAIQQNPEGRILIYCGTRAQTEEIVLDLQNRFERVGFYHAGLSAEDRSKIQKDYEQGELRILAATNAFGMGIDHPNVRLVAHAQMPANIESLYQEMGRAGRDGKPSTCLLLYSKKDKGLHAYFITKAELDKDLTNRRWRALETIVQFAEGGECRHAGILTYFKDSRRLKACGHCDVCDPQSPRRIGSPERRAFTPAAKTRSKSKSKISKTPTKDWMEADLTPEEEIRFDVLREWRKNYAEENDIPAFIVFSNKTLKHLAQKDPSTLNDLEKVYGLGEHKIQHLGSLILEKLAELR